MPTFKGGWEKAQGKGAEGGERAEEKGRASVEDAPSLCLLRRGLFGDLERFPAHEPDEPFRRACGAPVAPCAGVFGHALGKQGLALGVHDIVHKDKGSPPDFAYPGVDMDQIVISGGPPVAALGFAYGQHDAEAFHLGVAHAHIADVLAAGTLEKMQVFCVIEVSHRVGLSVGDAVGEPNIGSGKIVHEQHPLLKVPQKRGAGSAVLAAAVLALGLLAGCTASLPVPAPSVPSRNAAGDLVPESDERAAMLAGKVDRAGQRLRSWKELAPALRASRAHIAGREPGQVAVAHGDVAVTWGDVARTLDRLEALLPRLDVEPGLLAEQFRWVKLKDGAAFSGYYEPVVKASRTRKPGYTAPLYRVPPDLRELNLGNFKTELIGQRIVYRLEKGKPVPYYARAEIDGLDGKPGVLRGRGLELAWLSDPVDAFFLQVQGSGRLRFEDGKEMPVRFAGSNGKPYLSIGRYLADQGEIPPGQVSMQSIRQWLRDHPGSRDDLLRRNQRYIFFRKGPESPSGSITSGPVGSMGSPLSSMVSLAVDRTTFPLGSVLAFDVAIPDPSAPAGKGPVPTMPLFGIGLAQDTGEAIKGRRVDLFCGKGARAAYVAGHLNGPGEIWMLLAK